MQAAPAGVAAATVLYRPDPALLDALLTVLESDKLRLFIFVNGPLEEVVEARLALLARATLLRSPRNVGLGAGLNAVVEAAQAQGLNHVLLFDQDSTPEAGLAATLTMLWPEAERRHGRIAAIGPLLTPPPGESYLPIRYDRRSKASQELEAVDFLPTSGTLVSVAAWRSIGAFRADYFVDGIDVEWCLRGWSLGFASVLAEKVTMSHRWGHEDGDGDGGRVPQILRQSRLRCYYYLRNASHLLRLAHVPARRKAITALRLVAQAGLLVLRAGAPASMLALSARALRDGLTGRLGPAPSAE